MSAAGRKPRSPQLPALILSSSPLKCKERLAAKSPPFIYAFPVRIAIPALLRASDISHPAACKRTPTSHCRLPYLIAQGRLPNKRNRPFICCFSLDARATLLKQTFPIRRHTRIQPHLSRKLQSVLCQCFAYRPKSVCITR